MVALFMDDNKTNDDGDGKENGKKWYVCIKTNNKLTFLHVYHAFLYICLPLLHHYDMKLLNFKSRLYGVDEHNTKIVAFFFLTYITIDTVPKKISPRFAKLNEIE